MSKYILFYLPRCGACELIKQLIDDKGIRDQFKYINARTYTGSHKIHLLPVIVCMKTGKEYVGKHAIELVSQY